MTRYTIKNGDNVTSIKTLEELADYINNYDGYDNNTVESACTSNGWAMGDDEWHIANDGKQQVIFDDNCVAEVIPL